MLAKTPIEMFATSFRYEAYVEFVMTLFIFDPARLHFYQRFFPILKTLLKCAFWYRQQLHDWFFHNSVRF